MPLRRAKTGHTPEGMQPEEGRAERKNFFAAVTPLNSNEGSHEAKLVSYQRFKQ
jgi:hypothetical protein